jgi:hypothetical protein
LECGSSAAAFVVIPAFISFAKAAAELPHSKGLLNYSLKKPETFYSLD